MPEGRKEFPEKYCAHFGELAVEMGFITQDQLGQAMEIQIKENLNSKPRKLIGQILFEQDWMTPQQIDRVLNRLFENKGAKGREEELKGQSSLSSLGSTGPRRPRNTRKGPASPQTA